MTEREERLEAALRRIKQWADAPAAPATIGRPDSGDVVVARMVLKASGIDLDALYAAWARHILDGVGEICVKALARPVSDDGA